MPQPEEPDPYQLADGEDELDWGTTRRGAEGKKRMRMFATDDDTVETVPYDPDAN